MRLLQQRLSAGMLMSLRDTEYGVQYMYYFISLDILGFTLFTK